MKRIVLMIAFFAMCVVAHADYDWNTNNRLGKNLNQPFKMTGTGIVGFAKAINKVLPYDNENATVDKANGYIETSSEGDGHYRVNYCVWKRSDGKRMYVVSYDIGENMPSEVAKKIKLDKCVASHFNGIIDISPEKDGSWLSLYNVGYQAYLYNPQTHMLEPIELPVDKMLEPQNGVSKAYYLQLPQKGKNIEVKVGVADEEIEFFKLVWNGKNGFKAQNP